MGCRNTQWMILSEQASNFSSMFEEMIAEYPQVSLQGVACGLQCVQVLSGCGKVVFTLLLRNSKIAPSLIIWPPKAATPQAAYTIYVKIEAPLEVDAIVMGTQCSRGALKP